MFYGKFMIEISSNAIYITIIILFLFPSFLTCTSYTLNQNVGKLIELVICWNNMIL